MYGIYANIGGYWGYIDGKCYHIKHTWILWDTVHFSIQQSVAGAGGDLQQVERMARAMVTQFGMSDVGPAAQLVTGNPGNLELKTRRKGHAVKFDGLPGLVNSHILPWKDPPCLMGKSTISTGPFSIALC